MSAHHFALFHTRFGHGAVVAGDAGVVEVFLPFGRETAEDALEIVLKNYPGARQGGRDSGLAAGELERYFSGERVSFSAPLDLRGLTPFQMAVCHQVLSIGYGRVCSYGEVARCVGSPGGARGVGGVMAANLLPILIPCHRVVSADGGLGGYSGHGGIDSKKALLLMEGVSVSPSNRVVPVGSAGPFCTENT